MTEPEKLIGIVLGVPLAAYLLLILGYELEERARRRGRRRK